MARQFGDGYASLENIFSDERSRWSIAQKGAKQLFKLDQDLKDVMAKEGELCYVTTSFITSTHPPTSLYTGIVPNTWVFPRRMALYAAMAPKEHEDTNSVLAAKQNYTQDPERTYSKFRGSSVHECKLCMSTSTHTHTSHTHTPCIHPLFLLTIFTLAQLMRISMVVPWICL